MPNGVAVGSYANNGADERNPRYNLDLGLIVRLQHIPREPADEIHRRGPRNPGRRSRGERCTADLDEFVESREVSGLEPRSGIELLAC